jgi:hypothetical protein
LGKTLEEMLKESSYILKQGGYTIDMLKRETGHTNPFELVETIPHINEVESKNTVFYLFERA